MADVEYDYDIDSDSTNTYDIVGLDNIKTDNKFDADLGLKLELAQPFKAETASAIDIEPLELTIKPLEADLDLKTNSNLTLDLKPAVIDLCLTTNVGKIPNMCVRLPYQHHVGFTLFGTEIWGYSFSGQQDMVVEELDKQPKVIWGETAQLGSASHAAPKSGNPPSRHAGGLRVRLGS